MKTTNASHRNRKLFSASNWEYILKTVAEQVKQTAPKNKKEFQLEFNKRIEDRYNHIETVHQPLALKIARKFKFMTAHERATQYLDYPPR